MRRQEREEIKVKHGTLFAHQSDHRVPCLLLYRLFLCFTLLVSDYSFQNFTTPQTHQKSSRAGFVTTVHFQTLNTVAAIIFKVLQQLGHLSQIDRL